MDLEKLVKEYPNDMELGKSGKRYLLTKRKIFRRTQRCKNL